MSHTSPASIEVRVGVGSSYLSLVVVRFAESGEPSSQPTPNVGATNTTSTTLTPVGRYRGHGWFPSPLLLPRGGRFRSALHDRLHLLRRQVELDEGNDERHVGAPRIVAELPR